MIPFLVIPCVSLTLLPSDLPRLFTQQSFNSRDLAQAVNYFVAMGEERTAKRFAALASDFHSDWKREQRTYFSLNSRLSWMCRILFEPEGKEPLREPWYGELALPHHSMQGNRILFG